MVDSGQAMALEAKGVGFHVGGAELLAGIDLGLQGGRLYGLIGHNGSGKTTLLKLLARQQSPTAGTLSFGGRPLAEWPQRELARHIGYMAQHPPDATGLTVRELASLGRYPWHGAVGRFTAEDRECVRQALSLTGMDPFAHRLVDTLSGGERQRAWLAMLVTQNSGCMLLDEPIAALDIAHQMDVMERIRGLCVDQGITVVAVLHDINVAARFCDEVVALDRGRKVAHGSPDEVMQPEVLERIYGLPMGVVYPRGDGRPISYVA